MRRCPRCGSGRLSYEQLAAGVVAVLDWRRRLTLGSDPLALAGVRARCEECQHEWRLRRVLSLSQLGLPGEG